MRKISRRGLLRLSLGTMGGLAATGFLSKTFAAACGGLTPPQTSGPFYPEDPVLLANNDNDLTRVQGRSGQAKGQIIYLEGQVLDRSCNPVPNAVVDIWQANADGRYNHSADAQNPKPLDPNFQSRGVCVTDSQGRYNFKTIIPGAYPADSTWMRPSHIHFRVSRIGYRELTTQMYFKGSEYLDQDLILQSLSAAEQASVVVDFQDRQLPTGEKIRIGNFPVVIERIS